MLRTATSPIPSASGLTNANFHSAHGAAHRFGAKRLQIVQGDRGARFRAAVAVVDRNAEIVEKLDRGGLGERAADEQRAQTAAESLVNILQQHAAERGMRAAARECAIDGDQRVQHAALERRQGCESFAQAALKIFQDQRHNGHVGDFVARECVANKFGAQRAQMHDGAAAGERHDEAAHEIDGVICGNDAQIARARPKRKNRRHGHALLEIILVREDAALGTASCAGGIDDAGGIFALPRARTLARANREIPPSALRRARSAFGGASLTSTVRGEALEFLRPA